MIDELNLHINLFDLFLTLLIISIVLLLKGLILKLVHSKVKDTAYYHKIKRRINIVFFVISIFLISSVWLKFGGTIGAYLGIITAALAVALKDLLINLAAWIFIITRKPFAVGDRIEIIGLRGDIIDQRIFQFSMMELGNWVDSDQSTGRIVHVPNAKVFTDHIANYTIGFAYIWNEVRVLLSFESDWRSAKLVFREIGNNNSLHLTTEAEKKIKAASKKYMIFYKNLTPIVYTNVKESGVELTIRYLCEPQRRRSTVDAIWGEIMDYIESTPNVDLAYPTIRMFQS